MLEKSNVFSEDRSPAFGIDLGTTNSAIALLKSGKTPEIIPMRSGSTTLPSCVMYKGKDSKAIVGLEAYESRHKSNVIYSVKRFMGSGKKVNLSYEGVNWSLEPAEISAEILKELVYQISDRYKDVRDVVITVPADFNISQINDTIKAGKLAGLNVLQVLREPTSAALVLGLDEKMEGKVLVYDLGGGTFDVSLLSINNKVDASDLDDFYAIDSDESDDENSINKTYIVESTRGDSHLGGDDLDRELLNILLKKIKVLGIEVDRMPLSYKEDLLLRIEKLKKHSTVSTYGMPIQYSVKGRNKTIEVDVEVSLTSNDFFDATRIIFDKTRKLVDELLNNYNGKLDGIVLVGGSTKNVIIKGLLETVYDIKIYDGLNPDESVALGAGLHARTLKFKDSGISVLDVLSNGIGVMADNKITTVIPRDSTVPCSVSRLFTTRYDNQEDIYVQVYSGNSVIPEDCDLVGTLHLDNVPKGKAGYVGVTVKLSVDSNGLLECFVSMDGVYKSITLSNVIGKDSNKTSSMKDKKISRWRTYSVKIKGEDSRSTLLNLVDVYEETGTGEEDIIDFIRRCRESSLTRYESQGHKYGGSPDLINVE